jgi:hypothetical protein
LLAPFSGLAVDLEFGFFADGHHGHGGGRFVKTIHNAVTLPAKVQRAVAREIKAEPLAQGLASLWIVL